MSELEIVAKIKGHAIHVFLAFLVTAFTVPFITYDTGLRCVTDPCTGAAARGGLIEFLAKSNNLNAYLIDYWLFLLAFIGLIALIEYVVHFAKK